MPIKAIRLRTIGIIIILIVILLITVSIIITQVKNKKINQMEELIQQVEATIPKKPTYEISIKTKEIKLKIPNQYQQFSIIGKLEIPKIELVTYIIEQTNQDTLNKSVTKLCGPDVNKIGNLCITGHNYRKPNMFWKLKKLEIGDQIKLTDLYGQYCIYRVYAIEKVLPNDTTCLEQETRRRKESNVNYLYYRSFTEVSSKIRRSI